MSPLDGVPHAAICGSCFEAWPCLHQRQRARRMFHERAAREACHRCGKPVTGMVIEIRGGGLLGEDIRFHGRQGACRRKGLRRLGEAIDSSEDPIARLDLERERDRLDNEQLIARAEREARRLRAGGGSVTGSEELSDRLVIFVKLDLLDGEQRTEWRLGAPVDEQLAIFAASRLAGFERARAAA